MALGVLLFLFVSIVASALASSQVTAFSTSPIADLSNQARIANGIAPLSVNGLLNNAAQAKANHMVANGYFEHTAPDGTTGWYFVGQAGYVYHQLGENLAASNEDDAAVVNGWMNSPGHRANLLNPGYSDVGYGIAYMGSFQGYSNVTFVVAIYGKPSAPAPAPVAPPPVAPATTVESEQTPPQTGIESPASEAPQPQTPEEKTTEPIEQEDTEKSVVPAAGATGSGTKNLDDSGFRVTENMVIGIFIASGVFFAGGIAIEILRFYRYMHHVNFHHHAGGHA